MNKQLTVGNQTFEITPMRAASIAKFANVLGTLTIGGRKTLRELKVEDGNDFMWAVLAAVDEKALLTLGVALTGWTYDFVKENFALDWLVEALMYQFEATNLRGVIANFTSLAAQVAN